MASLRQIRSQIKSIQGTQQIMRAMGMVSASKLQRAQGRLLQARPGLAYLDGLVRRLLADYRAALARRAAESPTANIPTLAEVHPFFDQRLPRGAQVLVVVTSDTGLCSTYNTHLVAAAERFLERRPPDETWQIIPIGKRGARYFAKRRWPVLDGWLELGGRPDPVRLRAIGDALVQRFMTRADDGVAIAYTHFVSMMHYRPTVELLLPLEVPTGDAREEAPGYIYEPTPERVLEAALPLWAATKTLVVLLEALTSEHSARMVAMKNASDNAKELAHSLTLQRNKIRQTSITRELLEIVGTAEALK